MPTDLGSSVVMPTPKQDYFAIVEETIRTNYEKSANETAALKDMLDKVLEKKRSMTNPAKQSTVEKGIYAGQRAMVALQTYMKARRGMKISLAQIANDLAIAGANPGTARGKKKEPAQLISHKIRIGLGNNTRVFDWHPRSLSDKGNPIVTHGYRDDQVTVWLAPTADIPYLPPSRMKKRSRYKKAGS